MRTIPVVDESAYKYVPVIDRQDERQEEDELGRLNQEIHLWILAYIW